jgi:hypothetical protein
MILRHPWFPPFPAILHTFVDISHSFRFVRDWYTMFTETGGELRIKNTALLRGAVDLVIDDDEFGCFCSTRFSQIFRSLDLSISLREFCTSGLIQHNRFTSPVHCLRFGASTIRTNPLSLTQDSPTCWGCWWRLRPLPSLFLRPHLHTTDAEMFEICGFWLPMRF